MILYKNWLLGLLLVVGMTSCGNSYFFEKKHTLPDSEWSYDHPLEYSFQITDTSQVFNILLEIDHSTEYAFQNCYFKIHTIFPSGEKTEQLLSVDLADGIGRWQGDCNREDCTILVDLQKNAFFNKTGEYQIQLEQYMRKNPLAGINALTIMLEDTGNRR